MDVEKMQKLQRNSQERRLQHDTKHRAMQLQVHKLTMSFLCKQHLATLEHWKALKAAGKLTDQDFDDIIGRMTKLGPDGKPVVQVQALAGCVANLECVACGKSMEKEKLPISRG